MHIQVNTFKRKASVKEKKVVFPGNSFPHLFSFFSNNFTEKKSSASRMNNQEIKIRYGTKQDTSLCKS